MLVLGLTGNIGCGKSSLSNIFRKNGIHIIDADIISREIFYDESVLEEVFKCFGDSIKNEDHTLNRKALGNIVFNDDDKLIQLNNLTHPKIKGKILDYIKDINHLGEKIVVIDAALLIEGGFLDLVCKLLVVTCDENVQIDRIQRRDNCTKEEALSRINSQISQQEKSRYGDYIIDNSGNLIELEDKANKFISFMKENWCE